MEIYIYVAKVLAGLLVKAGTDELRKRGYMPQSYYVREAFRALRRDDLDEAVRNCNLSVQHRKPSETTAVAREIIVGALGIRIDKTWNRLTEIRSTLYPSVFSARYWRSRFSGNRAAIRRGLLEEEQGCIEALKVLERLRLQLQDPCEDD